MLSNTRFSMAVHVLCALAYNEGRTLGSEELARTVGTNPSFLRGLIGGLRAAGLVATHRGKGGGTTLARPPSRITLDDVYRAAESRPAIKTHECDANSPCPVAQRMDRLLAEVGRRISGVVVQELERTTVADLVRTIRGGSV